jgi:hypothetical protein
MGPCSVQRRKPASALGALEFQVSRLVSVHVAATKPRPCTQISLHIRRRVLLIDLVCFGVPNKPIDNAKKSVQQDAE